MEASSISLAWNAPPEEVTGYIVRYGTESGEYTLDIDAGNVTSYVVTGLTTGQVYYFVVQAYNSAGISAFSAEVSGAAVNQVPVACSATVSPTSAAVGAGGDSGTLTVTTGSSGGFNRSMQQWPPVYQRGWHSRASCAVVC